MEKLGHGTRGRMENGVPERTPSTDSSMSESEEITEEAELHLEFGPLHHERVVLGSFTIGGIFHSFLSLVFCLLFYVLCVHVQGDPESEIVEGHTVPYRVFGVSAVAYATTTILDIVAWAWTIDSYRGRLYIFPLFVNIVSFMCDLACAFGWPPIWICSNGRRFVMMRYVKWGITSPSLIYMYSSLSSMADMKVLHYNGICLGMLGAGALSACTGPPHNLAYLFASITLWILLMQYLNELIDNTILNCAPDDEEYRKGLGVAKVLLLVGWVAMPVIFILAQYKLVDPTVEECLYEIMDFMTKAGGASMILHSSLQTCVEKETERRQKLLAVKRNNCSHMLESMVKVHDELLVSTLQTQVTSIVGMVSVAERMLEELRSTDAAEGAAASRTERLQALHTLAQCSLASFGDFCLHAVSAEAEGSVPELVDVGDLLGKILLVLRSRLAQPMMAELAFDSPPQQLFVRAAPALLQQVLFALLSFLLHRMSASPPPLSARAEARARVALESGADEHGERVLVRVSDSVAADAGLREELEEALGPSSRLGQHAQMPPVLKSLAVGKALAEQMGGALSLSLPAGGGPCFTLDLPAGARLARGWTSRIRPSRTSSSPGGVSSPPLLASRPADTSLPESLGLRRRLA